MDGKERLSLFCWKQEAQKPDRIFGDQLLGRAKKINLRYANIYSGVPENDEKKEEEWRALDAFTRYSNVSAADYHEIQLKILKAIGEPAEVEKLSPKSLELLAELEHIRWCRYHYLNNWRYGVPDNGKAKDKTRRIHADLVPYESLTDSEKEKDRENIRVMLSIR